MGTVVTGDLFTSFAELRRKISEYEEKKHVQLNLRDTRTLQSARKRAPKRIEGSNMELKYYSLHYTCVYGGKKYRSAGHGIRARQRSIKQDCKAGIKLSLSRNKQFLVVTEVNEVHNHPVSLGIYSNLPKQRRMDRGEKEMVETMMSLGMNKKLLLLRIQQATGKAVTLKDLNNLHNQWKNQFTKNDLSAVVKELQEIKDDSDGGGQASPSTSPQNTVNTHGGIKEETSDMMLSADSPTVPHSVMVGYKYENPGLAVNLPDRDAAQLHAMELQSWDPEGMKASGNPHFSGGDLDSMDLDQLKREKIKMQLKVLKLQEEYYNLQIKKLKQ